MRVVVTCVSGAFRGPWWSLKDVCVTLAGLVHALAWPVVGMTRGVWHHQCQYQCLTFVVHAEVAQRVCVCVLCLCVCACAQRGGERREGAGNGKGK
jgi:hypothetical protein